MSKRKSKERHKQNTKCQNYIFSPIIVDTKPAANNWPTLSHNFLEYWSSYRLDNRGLLISIMFNLPCAFFLLTKPIISNMLLKNARFSKNLWLNMTILKRIADIPDVKIYLRLNVYRLQEGKLNVTCTWNWASNKKTNILKWIFHNLVCSRQFQFDGH